MPFRTKKLHVRCFLLASTCHDAAVMTKDLSAFAPIFLELLRQHRCIEELRLTDRRGSCDGLCNHGTQAPARLLAKQLLKKDLVSQEVKHSELNRWVEPGRAERCLLKTSTNFNK